MKIVIMNLVKCQSLHCALCNVLMLHSPCQFFRENNDKYELLNEFIERVESGYAGPSNEDAAFDLHKTLNAIYDYQINSNLNAPQYDPILMEVMLRLEKAWITDEEKRIPYQDMPSNSQEFARWLRTYILSHESSEHHIFDYLANRSTQKEMSYFFSQEVTIDPRFDDLIALMQVGISDLSIKLELAENYWDEMGNGSLEDIHSLMFAHLCDELDVFEEGEGFSGVLARASWQALACSNTLLYSVLHRKNFDLALGALGAVELISPLHFTFLTKGFGRLGLSEKAKRYHELHIAIDARHGNGWLHNAIVPRAEKYENARNQIFKGATLRMNTSLDYYNYIATIIGGN